MKNNFSAYAAYARKGPNSYAHKLASEHINSKLPVTAKIINDILAYCNISISDDILNNLINSPRIFINDLLAYAGQKIQ